MIHEKIETFLESRYKLFILSFIRIGSISSASITVYVRQKFPEKITVMAMNMLPKMKFRITFQNWQKQNLLQWNKKVPL